MGCVSTRHVTRQLPPTPPENLRHPTTRKSTTWVHGPSDARPAATTRRVGGGDGSDYAAGGIVSLDTDYTVSACYRVIVLA